MAYENLTRLAEVMNQLRSPGGCPWDAEQTHESLLKYLLEESYEFIETIESGNRKDMLEELGDILLQVFFHARIAEEHESFAFNIDDVAKAVADKLISRHPHVFAGTEVDSSADVLDYRAQKNHLTMPPLPNREMFNDETKFGDELMSMITWAVQHEIDPEIALRKAALKYRAAISEQESTGESR